MIANTLTIAKGMGKFGAPAPHRWIGLGDHRFGLLPASLAMY
jgi:hypothetical protein